MRRKDKDPSEEGNWVAGEREEAVRLPVPASRSDPDEVLRRARKSMEFNDTTRSYIQEQLHEEGLDPKVEGVNPEQGWIGPDEEGSRVPKGFIALGFIALLGLVVWAVVLALRAEYSAESKIEDLSEILNRELLDRRESIALLDEIEDTARRYLGAETVAEKIKFVRDQERVAPLMESYYKSHPLEPLVFRRVSHFSSLGITNRPFLILSITVGGVGEADEVSSFVVAQESDGKFRFDWESEVAYQPMSVEAFIASKSTEATDFRMYVKKDHFYNFEFSDAERYLSVILTERDTDSYLFGYVERGGEAYRAVEKLMEKSTVGQEPAIVRVRFMPETTSRRSVLIEKIVAPRWIYLAEPESASP